MPSEGTGGLHGAGSNREHERSARPSPAGRAPAASVPRPLLALGRSELGQSILEYALVIAVVALVVIAIIWMIGPQLAAVFSSVYESVVIIPTPPSG